MSRIDDLFNEMNPRGVEYVELQDLFTLRNGYTPPKSNAAFWTGGSIPWFRMEDIRENGRILADSIQHIPDVAVKGGNLFPANSMLVATSATIGEHALVTVPHLSNQRFTSLSLKPAFVDFVDMRFIYYCGFILDQWCISNTTTSSFSSVDMAAFKKFRFPVPPLELQREIVEILDRFSHSEAALERELQAELEARRRRYAHFQKLAFLRLEEAGVPRVPLREVGTWYGGGTPSKARPDYWKSGTIPWISPKDMGLPTVSSTEDYITETAVAESATKLVPKDSVALVVRSSILNHTLPIAFIPVPAALNQDMKAVVARPDILPKYLFHALRAQATTLLRFARRSGGSVGSLESGKLWQFEIPVPAISEQERLVELLDVFDARVNDLRNCLTEEISARRKQYVYHRDRLLTFKEAA